MAVFDRLRTAGIHLGHRVADSVGAAVYMRQWLRGNRVAPASAGVAPDALASPGAPGTVPVLLIHGYLANRGSLHLLERRLTERGYVVMTYPLGTINTGDIRESAGLIARKVESLLSQAPIDHVDIVGHSMGGLVGLYYVKRLGGRHRVRKLVMLGSPAGGTWSAIFGLVTAPMGKASVQLLPGSSFLRELHESPLPPGVEVVSVAGDRDIFAPIRSTALEGVRAVTLPAGHAGLLVDEDVVDALDAILRAPPDPQADKSAAP